MSGRGGAARGGSRGWVSRCARAFTGWAVVACLLVGVVVLAAGRADSQEPGQEQEEVHRGAALYAAYCASCHGAQGQGGPADEGLLAGPPLHGLEVAYVDLTIRTGRMPIIAREASIVRDPELTGGDRAAIVSWMSDALDLEGEVPVVREGNAPRGRILFNDHCASCHSTTGYGGVAGGGVRVRPTRGVDEVAVFSATRVGPFAMPPFSEDVLSDEDVADIAAAVVAKDAERPSPLAITDVTHVSGTIYVTAMMLVLIGLVGLIARMPRIAVEEEEFDWPEGDEPEEEGDERRE